MQRRTGIILLILGLAQTGCLDSALDATDTVSNARISYLKGSFDGDVEANDHFRVIGITPQGEEWKVVLEYSGGCNEHSFYTWWDESWHTDQPAETGFYLSHDSNGDLCEAIVRDTLYLDMNRVINQDYLDPKPTIVMVNTSDERRIKVDRDLAALTQSTACKLDASIALNSCGSGIWNDRWLMLDDSIGAKGKTWIIPVKNAGNVGLDQPESGEYKVGITLLFGFQNNQLNSSCYVFDDGLAVPAQINCISLK